MLTEPTSHTDEIQTLTMFLQHDTVLALKTRNELLTPANLQFSTIKACKEHIRTDVVHFEV